MRKTHTYIPEDLKTLYAHAREGAVRQGERFRQLNRRLSGPGQSLPGCSVGWCQSACGGAVFELPQAEHLD